jgi:hypothetical protein
MPAVDWREARTADLSTCPTDHPTRPYRTIRSEPSTLQRPCSGENRIVAGVRLFASAPAFAGAQKVTKRGLRFEAGI